MHFTENEKLMGFKTDNILPLSKFNETSSFKDFTKTELIESLINCSNDGRKLLKRQLILIFNYRYKDTTVIDFWIFNGIKESRFSYNTDKEFLFTGNQKNHNLIFEFLERIKS